MHAITTLKIYFSLVFRFNKHSFVIGISVSEEIPDFGA